MSSPNDSPQPNTTQRTHRSSKSPPHVLSTSDAASSSAAAAAAVAASTSTAASSMGALTRSSGSAGRLATLSPQLVPTMMPNPSTPSELQLYAVLKKANLMSYYGTFIEQGGDDVTQLLEAQDEEFLEIMALVGMATKPLHVRRLQKVLQEFSKSPNSVMSYAYSDFPSLLAASNMALGAMAHTSVASDLPAGLVTSASVMSRMWQQQQHAAQAQSSQQHTPQLPAPVGVTLPTLLTQHVAPSSIADVTSPLGASAAVAVSSPWPIVSATCVGVSGSSSLMPSAFLRSLAHHHNTGSGGSGSSGVDCDQQQTSSSTSGGSLLDRSGSPSRMADQQLWQNIKPTTGTPVLNEAQQSKIGQCAHAIGFNLKEYEPKLVQNKKRISPELLRIIRMAPSEPGRLEHFRRYAAIYGRFDAKRKPDRPLTLHEVSVNEAAAQICLFRPALLTRRDELFPLARQCVKDAGYHYVKGTKRAASENDVGSPQGGPSSKNKRGSPAESVSSYRSQTPSSCAGPEDTPPPTQVTVTRNTSEQALGALAALSTQSASALNLAMPASAPAAMSHHLSQQQQQQQQHQYSTPNLATRQPMNVEQVGGAWTVVKREPSASRQRAGSSTPTTSGNSESAGGKD